MPIHTSVSFPGRAPIALKFSEDERAALEVLQTIGSGGLREATGLLTYDDVAAAADARGVSVHAFLRERVLELAARESKNAARPYSGWPAGAGASEATAILRGRTFLDPFAGRANYAALAAQHGMRASWCEISPVFQRVAEGRLTALFLREEARGELAERIEELAEDLDVPASAPRDAMLGATRDEFLPRVSRQDALDAAADFLMRLRFRIDAFPSRALTGIVEAAVVEALPRTTGELDARTLQRDLRRELRDAARFAREERPLATLPQRIASDARDLASMPPLGIEVVITNPPSLNFATYTLPAAAWFLGVRRPRSADSPETSTALDLLASTLGPGRRPTALVQSIRRDVAKVQRKDERMARIVANYFLAMAQSFAAIVPHLTARATVALEIEAKPSRIAGVAMATKTHLATLLKAHGCEEGNESTSPQFLVVRRRS